MLTELQSEEGNDLRLGGPAGWGASLKVWAVMTCVWEGVVGGELQSKGGDDLCVGASHTPEEVCVGGSYRVTVVMTIL